MTTTPPVPSHFFAQLSRMKLIYRWPLMRNIQKENICEHSLQVAMVAHILALIENRHFGGHLEPERAALIALYHDASEVLTGDLPTPVKYHNPDIAREYKQIEKAAEQRLLALLPAEFQDEFRPLLDSDAQDPEHARVVKAADSLCAYTKCLEELAAGNQEFELARRRLEAILAERMTPAVDYFIKVFIPSFSLTLDEMSGAG